MRMRSPMSVEAFASRDLAMRYPFAVAAGPQERLLITCPLLPEVSVTCADDDDTDIVSPVREAIWAAFATRIADRRAIALPSEEPTLFVSFPPITVLKIELHNAMVATGMRKAHLRRLLGDVQPMIVDRLLDIDHASRLVQLEAALAAMGREIVITTRAAA